MPNLFSNGGFIYVCIYLKGQINIVLMTRGGGVLYKRFELELFLFSPPPKPHYEALDGLKLAV